MTKSLKISICVIAIIFLAIGGYLYYSNWKVNIMKIPPKAPVSITGEALSAIEIKLTWKDSSNNEEGFYLYRNSVLIANIGKNTTKYIDSGLKPATNYSYEIKAWNQAGESAVTICSSKTLNPPIIVWIDNIGVHDNGEEFLRGLEGEVQVGIVVTDGINKIQRSLPDKGFYHLKKDEIIQVNSPIFSTDEVGETLRVFFIAYEDDGGLGEQIIYKALDIVTKSYLGNPGSLLLTMAGVDFSPLFAEIFGAEDDLLGTFASEWNVDNNWGVGKYIDVKCLKDDGDVGLRLWFRIVCPVYDYSSENSSH
jgi:hypothetical protein